MNALFLPAALFLAALSPSPPPAGASARLAYEAPNGCPTEPEFRAAVSARGADIAPGGSTRGAAPVLAVTIRRRSGGFGGAFQVRDRRGTTDERVVNGRSCDDVVDALALVTAIALAAEPSAAAEAAAPTPAAAPAPAAPAAVEPLPPAAPPAPPDRLRGTTRIGPPRTETIKVGAGPLRFDLSRSAMFYGGATTGLVPNVVLPRYSLVLTMANFVTTPEGLQRITGLVYQAHVDFLVNGTYDSPDTRTKITGGIFGVDMCQSPHYDSKGLVLLLCGEYGGGLMTLETKGLDGATMPTKNAGFGVLSAVADVQYSFGGRFIVGGRLAGNYMFGDVTAERADGSRIFTSSHWSAYAMLGVGIRY
jgi:hypothetical protein